MQTTARQLRVITLAREVNQLVSVELQKRFVREFGVTAPEVVEINLQVPPRYSGNYYYSILSTSTLTWLSRTST